MYRAVEVEMQKFAANFALAEDASVWGALSLTEALPRPSTPKLYHQLCNRTTIPPISDFLL